GHILSAPYFQSLDSPTNRKFVSDFLDSRHGASGVTHFNMEETYLSFLYFKKALEHLIAAEGEDAISPWKIREYSRDLVIPDDESPEGEVRLDPDNLNSWLRPRIGRFNSKGQIDLQFDRGEKIPPEPFLLYPQRGKCRFDGLHPPSGNVVQAAS
ncbi:MAG: transporter substrate-binding protein, partial [Candidatus Omnitrophica bacterium]|nr:transporter substrate-binding protein [Candidatus Omnitrophota bacterium]